MICNICKKEFKSIDKLTEHLVKEHNCKSEDLYVYFNYSFETGEAMCPLCGHKFVMTKRQIKSHAKGISKAIGCCAKCSRDLIFLIYGNPSTRQEVKDKKKQTNLEKYGVENVFQLDSVKQKSKETNLKKYGVEYALQSNEVIQKSKETNLKKYGVEYVSQREDIKDRKKKKSLDKYGVENISQAQEVKDRKRDKSLEKYGTECTLQAPEVRNKIKETNLEKYGVENASQAEEVKEKIKQTNLEKYGVEYAIQSDEVQNKIKQTNLEKYGLEHPIQSDKVQEKVKQTNLEKYGYEYFLQSPESHEKIKDTILKKYGVENISQNLEVKEKKKQSALEKYGVEYVLQSEEVKGKSRKTNLEKYGTEYAVQSSEVQNKIKQTNLEKYGAEYIAQVPQIREKIKSTNLKKYGAKSSLGNLEVREKAKQTIIEKYGVEYFCLHEKCIKAGGKKISNINKEFQKFLKKNNIESELEFVLDNFGYDLKVGSTLVEINPYYTHNVTYAPYIKGKQRSTMLPNYHLTKTNKAKERGFNCVHVFDWDDWNKILYLLQPKEKLQARKCLVKEVINKKEVHEFLGKYHLQGSTKGFQYAFGLYHEGELVEVMTFGKPRYNKNYEYELLRLCSDPRYTVVGGASKLLNYFEKVINPKSIISYCDLSKFSGDVYKKLGFTLTNQTQPAKHWYSYKTGRHITDNLLNQRGYDQLHGTNFGKGTLNENLMLESSYVEIYDCGQLAFVK